MHFQTEGCTRVLCLHAAAKRLQIPERTLRYQASRGRIEGAFKQGKLWKFAMSSRLGLDGRSVTLSEQREMNA